MALPVGTVTFLFTDVVDSTALWERDADAMAKAVPAHDALITAVVEQHHGSVFKTVGDAVCAVFDVPGAALEAAISSQLLLAEQDWGGSIESLAVRMGVHTGVAQPYGDSDYIGPTLNRVARLTDAGHGGQILVSASTEALIEEELLDLGIHQLKGLSRAERVYQASYQDAPVDLPPIRTVLATTAGNLPLVREDLIGRAADIDVVVGALRDHSIVTVTGPGGVGKTLLATDVAARQGDGVRDGAWIIALASLSPGSDVYGTVASTLSIQVDGAHSVAASVVAALSNRQSLLVLDNAEHVLESTYGFATRVGSSCPAIQLLVTSREPLGVRGEKVVRLSPLATRAAESNSEGSSPAVEMLFRQISLSGTKLADTPETLRALRDIARRLDGMPLALELAAARVASLGLDGLLARLDRPLDLLANRRAPPSRHSTLHATIDWSYDLLSASERRVFRRLSIFAGGWTLAAAEEVGAAAGYSNTVSGAEVLFAIERLVDASMISAHLDESGGTRYSMLESLKQYGRIKLDDSSETEVAGETHARLFRGLAAEVAMARRLGEPHARAIFAAEFDNFRGAYGWGMETDNPGLFLEIPAVFGRNRLFGGSDEMSDWLRHALERPSASESVLFPIGLAVAAEESAMRGDMAERDRYADHLMALNRSTELSPEAQDWLAWAEFYSGHVSLEASEEFFATTQLDVHDEIERRLGLSLSYLYQNGNVERATEHARRILDLAESNSLVPHRGWCLYALGEACQVADPAGARSMLEEAVAIANEWGWDLLAGVSRVSLATTYIKLGQLHDAARVLRDAIHDWHLRGNWQHQWAALRNAAELLALAGRTGDAVKLIGAIDASPSSPDVYGAQGDRLRLLVDGASTISTSTKAMSGDQIVRMAMEALGEFLEGDHD